MATNLTRLVNHLRRIAARSCKDADAVLLERFARQGDEGAFSALVARHGAMVLNVCRRVLGDAHLAEDAGQAAFLVLARKATRIRDGDALANWLYGVAYRVACKARSARRRGPSLQQLDAAPEPADSHADPLAELTGRELLAVLEEEVQLLPQGQRLAVVLCCLEGLSQEEAARRLGLTAAAVKGRLERGRACLQERLVRRGLTLAVALAALHGTSGFVGACLSNMVAGTTKAAVAFAQGHQAGLPGVSVEVVRLARLAMKGTAMFKVKVALLLVIPLGLTALGAGGFMRLGSNPVTEDPKHVVVAPPQVKPKEAAPRVDQLKPQLRSTIPADDAPSEGIFSVAYSPDGKTLISGSGDKDVKLWDTASGKNVGTLLGHTAIVWSVACTPDGKTLASGSYDTTVKLWDVATLKNTATLQGHGDIVLAVAFSPDGKTLASASRDKSVKLWDVASGKNTATLTGHILGVTSVAYSPDGKTLVTGSFDKSVRLWDAATGKNTATFSRHKDIVWSVAFSPDDKTVASGSQDKSVKLWDVATGNNTATFESDPHIGVVWSVAFSPDGKTLASRDTKSVKLWDVTSGKNTATWAGNSVSGWTHDRDGVPGLAFSPDGKGLALGGANGVVYLQEVTTGKITCTLPEYTDSVFSLAYSPDGKTLASADAQGRVKLWDVVTGKTTATLEGRFNRWMNPLSLAFSPDGKTFAVAGMDAIELWDAATGKKTGALKGEQYVMSVAYSPDGKTLVAGGFRGSVMFWDVAPGKARATQIGHGGTVYCVVFSRDGKLLASGSEDGSVVLWNLANGRISAVQTLKTFALRLTFSNDGRMIATAGGPSAKAVKVWEVASGKERLNLEGHTGGIMSVAFSGDGKTLASGSFDGTIKLWDMATGNNTATLEGHSGPVWSVAYSPDGRTLASGSGDKTIKLWDMVPGK